MGFSKGEKQRLKNKYGSWALVTGASSGIGRELAGRLAEAGINLVLTARRVSLLKDLAGDLQARYEVETFVIETDLTKQESIYALIKAVENKDVGLLVAAAGFGTSGLLIKSPLQEELDMLQVNCAALLTLTHYFAKKFADRQRGGIILMSSMLGFHGAPFAAHYAATKAYVQSLGEALSVELRKYGVDVLAAAPGPVQSGFADRANMRMGMTLKTSDVGIPILKALGRQSTVLPGFLTKFLAGSLRLLPRWGKVRVMRVVMGGMTQHHSSNNPIL